MSRPLFGYREVDGKATCSNDKMIPYTTKTGRKACKFPSGYKRGPRQRVGGTCFWDSTRSKYYKKINGRTRWLKTDATCDNRGSVTAQAWKKGGYTRQGVRSAWNEFVSENYAQVRADHPSKTMGELMKELSKLYRAAKAGGAAMQVAEPSEHKAAPALPPRPSAAAKRSFNTQMKRKRRTRAPTFDAAAITQTQKRR